MSGENGYCPYCGSDNIVPYKVKYWWCNACNKPFVKPILSLYKRQEN